MSLTGPGAGPPDQGPSEPWDADADAGPREPDDGGLQLGRAAVLVVVAVILGVLLLQVGSRPPAKVTTSSASSSAVAPSHATTTAPPTTTTTVPHSSIDVVVANGTQVAGVAADFSSELASQGWSVGTPLNTNSSVSSSAVYYAAGEQDSAAIIASALGLKSTAVQALSSATPVTAPAGTQVVVVVGPDLAAHPPASTTTS